MSLPVLGNDDFRDQSGEVLLSAWDAMNNCVQASLRGHFCNHTIVREQVTPHDIATDFHHQLKVSAQEVCIRKIHCQDTHVAHETD